jgi:hypothetical protein
MKLQKQLHGGKQMDNNSFRQVDAFEYVDAYRQASKWTPDEIRSRLGELNNRIAKKNLSYLLAAYRGYEDALAFKENPHWFTQFDSASGNPYVVTLDQSK